MVKNKKKINTKKTQLKKTKTKHSPATLDQVCCLAEVCPDAPGAKGVTFDVVIEVRNAVVLGFGVENPVFFWGTGVVVLV